MVQSIIFREVVRVSTEALFRAAVAEHADKEYRAGGCSTLEVNEADKEYDKVWAVASNTCSFAGRLLNNELHIGRCEGWLKDLMIEMFQRAKENAMREAKTYFDGWYDVDTLNLDKVFDREINYLWRMIVGQIYC